MLKYNDIAEIIHSVHEDMRQNFIWTADHALYHVVERWGLPLRRGQKLYDDCDGWTFETLQQWERAGIPLSSMYPVICAVAREPFDHCVAGIETDRGLIISCCNQARVRYLASLPYWSYYRPGNGGRAPINQPWEKF